MLNKWHVFFLLGNVLQNSGHGDMAGRSMVPLKIDRDLAWEACALRSRIRLSYKFCFGQNPQFDVGRHQQGFAFSF